MCAGGSVAPARDLLRIDRIADVPEDHVRPRSIATIERGDHQVVVDGHLRRDPVLRAVVRDEFYVLRILRIGYIEDAPSQVEGMTHVEIPASVGRMVERHLERAVVTTEARESDHLQTVALPTGRDWIGERVRCERGDHEGRGGAAG